MRNSSSRRVSAFTTSNTFISATTTAISKLSYSSGSSVKSIKTKTIARGIRICKDWNISVDLKLPSQLIAREKTANIFSLQVNGTIDGEFGSRIPAVWLTNTGLSHPLWIGICNQIGDYWCSWMETPEIKTDQWVNLKIGQRESQATKEWIYEVKVDDKIIHSISNWKPQEWSNVNVIMGNTYRNTLYEPAKGEYRSFKLSSC